MSRNIAFFIKPLRIKQAVEIQIKWVDFILSEYQNLSNFCDWSKN